VWGRRTAYNVLHFACIVGKSRNNLHGIELVNPYADDVAFFHGSTRLLLTRHIYRAIDEAKSRLIKLSAQEGVVLQEFD